jgi:hypothetical protein
MRQYHTNRQSDGLQGIRNIGSSYDRNRYLFNVYKHIFKRISRHILRSLNGVVNTGESLRKIYPILTKQAFKSALYLADEYLFLLIVKLLIYLILIIGN